nr:hypothetical protein [Tanacetum cinerariifolium]
MNLSYKRLCVKVKSNVTINDKVKVIVNGKIFWKLVKELKTWSPKVIEAKDDDLSSVEEDKENNSENIKNDFELDNDNDNELDHPKDDMVHNNKGVSTATSGYNGVLKLKSGGSLLGVMDELIKAGENYGLQYEMMYEEH